MSCIVIFYKPELTLTCINLQLVEDIYNNELSSVKKVMMLEVSQYLELYLWKHYEPSKSSRSHIMSIMVMVNEKFRERVPPWEVSSLVSSTSSRREIRLYYLLAA